jgi:hypothetical protein
LLSWDIRLSIWDMTNSRSGGTPVAGGLAVLAKERPRLWLLVDACGVVDVHAMMPAALAVCLVTQPERHRQIVLVRGDPRSGHSESRFRQIR